MYQFRIGHYPIVEMLLNHSAFVNDVSKVAGTNGDPVLTVAARRNGNISNGLC